MGEEMEKLGVVQADNKTIDDLLNAEVIETDKRRPADGTYKRVDPPEDDIEFRWRVHFNPSVGAHGEKDKLPDNEGKKLCVWRCWPDEWFSWDVGFDDPNE